jgi:hypothetical protein
MYVGIRRDLSVPQQVVQSVHAALEAGWAVGPQEEHPSVIVLGFKSEESLKKTLAALQMILN